ncbi:hypothetical protein PVL29_009630 [Vitis rotundifolia]|uniref:Cytochrome P450 71D10 n=1 Tax=Vitis rotundifolia TaxID=103349 RepID=A0AA39DQS4_VITRO|nr:hypothetical protein PVL29_009630 [Vitis rotundifolia]
MEFPSSFLFPFLLFLFILFKVSKKSKPQISIPKRPPGPWKLPLIGNLHQLVGSLPHYSLRDLAKKYGPLMHLQLGQVSMLVVSSPEIAKEVMKTHDINFAQRPHLLATRIATYDSTDVAFSPYGDYWRQLRKICVIELLSAKRVKSFQVIRKEEISKLIRIINSSSRFPINLRDRISAFTYSVISRAALGKECKDHDPLTTALGEITRLASGFCLADLYPSVKWIPLVSGVRQKLEKVQQRIDGILQIVVDEHRERMKTTTGKLEEEKDLVDVLLKLQQDGDLELPLTDDNIKAVILDIFGGGGDTVLTAVEWAMAEMMKNPEVMKKAQAEVRRVFDGKGDVDETGIDELKFLKAVVSETLRLHPPFPLLLPRECREKCKINGYEVPVKTRVVINAWAIGRHTDYWTEAERFYPERFLDSSIDYKGADFGFIPFGSGRRICPGILFGIPVIELPLAQLLFHFDWKLPNGMRPEDLDMTEVHGLGVRKKHNLHLIPIPYSPLTVG